MSTESATTAGPEVLLQNSNSKDRLEPLSGMLSEGHSGASNSWGRGGGGVGGSRPPATRLQDLT